MASSYPADISDLRTEISAHLSRHALPGAETLEQRCRSYLEALCWPSGASCPRCEERRRLLWLESRSKWHCSTCRYQFSVTAGTLFHRSHLPLWKWFVAVHLMVESPHGVSANELRETIGGSYKTAWFATRRIRTAMRGSGAEILRSLIQAERERQTASPGTDDSQSASHPGLSNTERHALLLRVGRLFPGQDHRHLSAKYLHAYIDEMRWRRSNRDNPYAFRDTLLALLNSDGISYRQLIATPPAR